MINRRTFAGRTLSLGALTFLTGCDISDSDAVQSALASVSRWNDRVQAWLFSDRRLAPEFPESEAVRDFRFNAYYQANRSPVLQDSDYRLMLAGRIADKRPWTAQRLRELPRQSQVTRHVCVEGWSMIGKWTGTPMRTFLESIGADTTSRFVGFECADGYYEGIDMATALHPQTLMTFQLSDQEQQDDPAEPAPILRGCAARTGRHRDATSGMYLSGSDQSLQSAVRNLPAHLRGAGTSGGHELGAVHAHRRSGPRHRPRGAARGGRADAGQGPAADGPLPEGPRGLCAVQHQRHVT
jgi:hypothetical protein